MANLNGKSLDYNGGWVNVEKKSFWGKDSQIDFTFSADKNEELNDSQIDTYNWIIENFDKISALSYCKAEEYVKENIDEIKTILNINDPIQNIQSILLIKYILVTREGKYAICFNSLWDNHGVTIVCDKLDMIIGDDGDMWLYL